jgi:hypothetical protein
VIVLRWLDPACAPAAVPRIAAALSDCGVDLGRPAIGRCRSHLDDIVPIGGWYKARAPPPEESSMSADRDRGIRRQKQKRAKQMKREAKQHSADSGSREPANHAAKQPAS